MNRNSQGRSTPPADLGIATFDHLPTPLAKAQVIEASIESMPAWMNQDIVKQTVAKKKRGSGGLANDEFFTAKAQRDMKAVRYTRAFKLATEEARKIKHSRATSGKHGNGLTAIAQRYNTCYLCQPNTRKLSRSTLRRAINDREHHGVFPPKLVTR